MASYSYSTVTVNERGEIVRDRKSEYKQTFRNTIKTTKYMLNYVLREKKGRIYAVLKVILALYKVLPMIVYTIFPGLIITELTNEKRVQTLAIYLSVLVFTPIIDRIIGRFTDEYIQRIYNNLSSKFLRDYDYHSAKMDYESFEDPDIQTTNERVFGTAANALQVIDRLCALLSAVLGLAAIFSIIATLNIFIVIVVFLIMYLNSIITKRLNAKYHETEKELSKYQRYIGSSLMLVLHDIWFAKEVRIFDLKDYFADMLYDKRLEVNNIKIKNTKSSLNAQILFSCTNFIQQFLLYIYLIYLVLFKSLSIGNMTIYMSAVNQFAGTFNGIINSYLDLAKSGLMIHEFMQFMDTPLRQYETGTKEPKLDENSIIEFKNVSFKYPGSDAYALKNLSITLRGSEKLCIVGHNGSGKTTFIKLLTRLYFPTEGEILLNGININEYDYVKYQKLFSPVFQDCSLYMLTLAENIALSKEPDKERIFELCNWCGLQELIERLPKGLDTSVFKSRDEDGFQPSGGEGQRIAIARALYHSAPIYILDEPTASLDPIAEYEIYTQFNNMIKDRTAVLITHRLSAVQLADKVAVFSDGQVAEYGTHAELYVKGGIYTEMFDKQAQFYRDNPVEDLSEK